MNTPRRPSSGFTLVELLTVIAIIGVLAAILIATVGKARESARKAECASNIRQISTALLLYASTNRNQLPPVMQPSGTPLAGTPWSAMLYRDGYLPATFTGFSCPSDNVAIESNATATTTNPLFPSVARSYTACSPAFSPRTANGAPDSRNGLNLLTTLRPASTFMLTEWHLGAPRMIWENSAAVAGRDIIQGTKTLGSVKHKNGSRHYAYLDGHVAFLPATSADKDSLWGE